MRIIVTGAGGFLGRAALPLLRDHDLVAVDRALGALKDLPHVTAIEGDLGDPSCIERAFAGGCDALIHLATIPGGAAEQDPATAKAVNIDAGMALIDAAMKKNAKPRVVCASSIAVLGDDLPAHVDDSAPIAPMMLYGAHKAMMEQWVSTLTRRGAVDGVSIRFPGIMARPLGSKGVKSAYMSEVFYALREKRPFVAPVSADAMSWMISVGAAARAMAHALTVPATPQPLTLPALHVRMADLVAEIARQTGADPALVTYAPDAALEATFGSYPPLSTPAADTLGFNHDGSLERLVTGALEAIAKAS